MPRSREARAAGTTANNTNDKPAATRLNATTGWLSERMLLGEPIHATADVNLL